MFRLNSGFLCLFFYLLDQKGDISDKGLAVSIRNPTSIIFYIDVAMIVLFQLAKPRVADSIFILYLSLNRCKQLKKGFSGVNLCLRLVV